MSNPDLVKNPAKIRNIKPFRSLSLGAGVQSTVLTLMAKAIAYGFCGVRYNSGQRRLAWSEVEAEAEETPP